MERPEYIYHGLTVTLCSDVWGSISRGSVWDLELTSISVIRVLRIHIWQHFLTNAFLWASYKILCSSTLGKIDCRFSDKVFVLNTAHKLPKAEKASKLAITKWSFIFEEEGIILSLHGLQASSQLFPRRPVDQVESAEKRYKHVRGLENMTCEERIAYFFFILTKNQRWCISKMQKKIANGEVIICTVDRAKKKKILNYQLVHLR